MDKNQSNAFNMFKAILVVLNSFPTVWNSNATINAVVIAFQNLVNGLVSSEQNQRTGTVGVTLSKGQTLDALINIALAVADAGYAYAVSVSNMTLKQSCTLGRSTLARAKDVDVIALCQNVHDAVNPFAASLTTYGATSATIINLQNAINAFSSITGQPANARAAVRVATESIATQVTAGKKMLSEQLDPLMTQFKTSQPVFYEQYFAAREISNIGHRKTVILKGIIYTGSNVPIMNADVKLSGIATRKKITGADGVYKMTRLHVGTYTLTVSVTGFITQTKTLTVTQNGTVTTNFVLVASTGGGGTTTGTTPPATA